MIQNLHKTTGTSDPYVLFSNSKKDQVLFRTKPIKRDLNPNWNFLYEEDSKFVVPTNETLFMTVWDKDLLIDDFL
jgi:Ca2+-dependent lipid-binding protein